MDGFWTWVAALLTLMILSFLYRDNPFFKIAEHLFVGLAAGYVVAIEFFNVFKPNLWDPLTSGQDWWLIVPFLLGLMMITRFSKKYGWISRWPIGYMVGIYSGMAVIGFTEGDLRQAFAAAKYIRRRYTVHDLATDLGLFDDLFDPALDLSGTLR